MEDALALSVDMPELSSSPCALAGDAPYQAESKAVTTPNAGWDVPSSSTPAAETAAAAAQDSCPTPDSRDAEHAHGAAAEAPCGEDHPTIPFVSTVAPTMAQTVEAILFASDTPLSAARIADIVGDATPSVIERTIDELNERYAASGTSFRVQPIARGYQMMTLPVFAPWLAKLDKQRSQTRLTGATLEVLAIVAYKQPLMRADIEAVRGVASGEVLNRLREMGLIKIVGRAEIVGRPLLYGTTKKFLDVFGLNDLDELPPMEALTMRRPAALATAAATNDEPPALRAAAGA